MSTVATTQMKQLAAGWKTGCGFKSAVISGIVGDRNHHGGYHISRMDQSKTNYSVVRPDDVPGTGPENAAAAIDMTMNRTDMISCTKRLMTAYSNTKDPRRKYLNGFNGTVDGKVAKRWDVYARRIQSASADHVWHVHLEVRRRYVESATAVKAILSLLRGESVEQYLKSIGVTITPPKISEKPKPPPRWPGRELRRNDRATRPDTAVMLFQVQMLKRGWKSLGKADGFFGPKLESVVRRWQRVCGLKVDGIIGPKTWPTPWSRPIGS